MTYNVSSGTLSLFTTIAFTGHADSATQFPKATQSVYMSISVQIEDQMLVDVGYC